MRPELPVLIRARQRIAEPKNWGKGRRGYDRPVETCCASEAIEESWGAQKWSLRSAAFRRLYAAASLDYADKRQNIPDWNDAPERTHTEVLAAFDRAIEAAS
jgi:hypothetical protein